MERYLRLRPWVAVFIACVLVVLSSCSPNSPDPAAPPVSPNTEVEPETEVRAEGGEELPSMVEVVARAKPSVVAIVTEVAVEGIFDRSWTQEHAGSGFVIREDGYIVTNSHVLEDATRVLVLLDDGREFEADTMYLDDWTDVAVVRIPADDLPVAAVGSSAALRIGEPLVAIGNPLGLGLSATAGIASAVGVTLVAAPDHTFLDLIQTDAAINPGNSGGPLVNAAGEVIGINSIKIAQVGVEGMGYAIGIDQAMPIIDELIAHGEIVRPWLGVVVFALTPVTRTHFDLAVDTGVLVAEVVDGSPADDAGLEAGDVIVRLAGEDIENLHDFTRTIDALEIGNEAELIFWRGDERLATSAVLGPRPTEVG